MDEKVQRLARLENLNKKRIQSYQLNHNEVVKEYKKLKLPSNFEIKKKWAEDKLEKEKLKEKLQQEGKDYLKQTFLDIQADEAEKWEKKQKNKKNPDKGFSSYDDATARQYDKLTKFLKPDFDNYERKKQKLGDAFYPDINTPVHNLHKDSKEKIDSMVENLKVQVEKRKKFSRKKFDEDADIDYINEKNMRFNKNLERFYGKYTAEIKQNLERGTAV